MLRLVAIAKNHGADFLYDADSFDRMLGRGRFAEMDGRLLGNIRRVIECLPNQVAELGAHSTEAI